MTNDNSPDRSTDRLIRAIGIMAGCMASLEDGAEHMTCREIDSIVGVLTLAGFTNEAEWLVFYHAPSDTDDTDNHAGVDSSEDAVRWVSENFPGPAPR